MYVTRLLNGRPYQAFIPRPVFPSIEIDHIRRFKEIDSWLKRTLDTRRFIEDAPYTIAKMERRIASSEAFSCAERAVSYALTSRSFGCKQIKRANAILTGNPSANFRPGPGWVGAPHPSMAWHVGSPPENIEQLMKAVTQPPTEKIPASLDATIRLFRILQIHPFGDGNGRTARLTALRVIHERIGPATGYLWVVTRLWNRSKSNISTLSLDSQKSENLSDVFNHTWRIITEENPEFIENHQNV